MGQRWPVPSRRQYDRAGPLVSGAASQAQSAARVHPSTTAWGPARASPPVALHRAPHGQASREPAEFPAHRSLRRRRAAASVRAPRPALQSARVPPPVWLLALRAPDSFAPLDRAWATTTTRVAM